jgi:hypothetical protein
MIFLFSASTGRKTSCCTTHKEKGKTNAQIEMDEKGRKVRSRWRRWRAKEGTC